MSRRRERRGEERRGNVQASIFEFERRGDDIRYTIYLP
jgi:hypothetical protein